MGRRSARSWSLYCLKKRTSHMWKTCFQTELSRYPKPTGPTAVSTTSVSSSKTNGMRSTRHSSLLCNAKLLCSQLTFEISGEELSHTTCMLSKQMAHVTLVVHSPHASFFWTLVEWVGTIYAKTTQ